MDIIKIKYPSSDENWYQFGLLEGAVKTSNEDVEKWVNDCILSVKNQLEEGIESPYAFTASGNAMVIVFFSQDIQDNIFADENYFTVIIARDYEEGTFSVGELRKDKQRTLEEIMRDIDGEKEFELDGYEISIKKKEEI